MSNFHLSFPHTSEIIYHSICTRCLAISEYNKVGNGCIPVGKDRTETIVNDVIICVDCMELLRAGDIAFWTTGWK